MTAGSPSRTWLPPALVGIVALTLISLLPPVRAFELPNHGDIAHYAAMAERTFDGRIPYRDFPIEYPPAALPLFLAPAPVDDGYYVRFRALMLVFGAASIALLVFVLGRTGAPAWRLYVSALFVACYPLVLTGDLVFDRYDVWPAMLLLAAVASLAVARRGLSFGILGVATAAKFYSLTCVPLALLYERRRLEPRRVRKELLFYALAGLAFALPFAIIAPRGLGHPFSVLVRRPLHIESLGGSLLLGAHRLGLYRPVVGLSFAGSWDLSGTLPKAVALAQALVLAAALVYVWYAFARSRRDLRRLGTAVAAVVTAVTVFGKVFSPQFMTWLVLSVPLAGGAAWLPALALAEAALVLTRLYYDRYGALLALGGVSWVLLARNVTLLALLALLVRELRVSRQIPPRL